MKSTAMAAVTRSQMQAAPAKAPAAATLQPASGSHSHRSSAQDTSSEGRCPCGGSCPKCGAQGAELPPLVDDAVRSPGHGLDEETRAFMEPRFGADLSKVRVHTDAQAAESARAVRAQAYTVGQDVVFAQDRFAPGTSEGRNLLAHELAHTVQQRGGGSPPIDEPGSAHESTARLAGANVAAGQHVSSPLPAAGIGLSRSPDDDDERAKAVAEAEAALKKMDEEEQETARQEAEDEARQERRREEMLHPSLSLLKPDPKFEASKITDEQIYAGLDTDRDKAVAEAEAVIKDMVKTQQETKDEEAADAAADAEAEKSFGRRSLSLLDPSFEANLMTDEEIYESVREFKPEEAGYWAKQEADWLDKPMQLSNETKYVRKWREVTIEGVGDQGDRHEWVEDSHWTINGPSVLALVEYLTGEKPTPFERQLAAGQINAPEGFRPVAIGDRLGYYVEYGGSGDRNHVIYNRDGSEYSHTHSEVPLVDEGIGPLTLALPGIGLPSMLRGGAALARGRLSAGRTAVGWAGRALQPFARRAAFTGRLLIGRAEAGAGIAAPTALGGVTSADITIVEGRALGGQVSNVARALPAAGETTASVSAVKPPTALPTVAPDPGVVEAGAGATTTAAPSPFPWQAGAPWYRVNPGDAWRQADIGAGDVFASGYGGESAGEAATPAITAGGATTQAPGEDTQGIPEAISETDSGAVTAPINTGAAVERADMERIGEYEVIGPTRVENGVMYRETRGLYRPAGRTTSIRPILQLFRLMIAQARAQGAHELRITGQLIANKNVLKIQRLAEYFGGTARRIDANTNEIVLPVPEE